MDKYKCKKCGKIFDEYEMDYKKAQEDKKCLCRDCRAKEKGKKEIIDMLEFLKSKVEEYFNSIA